MRTCHICKSEVEDGKFCETCVSAFETRKAAESMTGDEREAEMMLLRGPLQIPFDLLHKRIEELVGRDVWTHEMGLNFDGLVREAKDRDHPTMEQVIGLIPEDKRIIVVA